MFVNGGADIEQYKGIEVHGVRWGVEGGFLSVMTGI